MKKRITAIVSDGAVGVPEACRFVGVRRTFLYEMMNKRLVKFVKLGKRRLIPRAELTRLLAEGLVGDGAGGELPE